jgi:hypothetical protein
MSNAKAQEALEIFKELADSADCATDLHNAFFGNHGKFGQLFPTHAEREEFAKTAEYAEIVRIKREMREREAATP